MLLDAPDNGGGGGGWRASELSLSRWKHQRIGVSTLTVLYFLEQKHYSLKQLSVAVQVKWTQSGENLFSLFKPDEDSVGTYGENK